MAIIKELLRIESNNTLSFGNHELSVKAKLQDFPFGEDLYKVKTFSEMTKLEKNDIFMYESIPGTSVSDFIETTEGIRCKVYTCDDTQITVGLEENTDYHVMIDGEDHGMVKTNLSGKLIVSIPHVGDKEVNLEIRK